MVDPFLKSLVTGISKPNRSGLTAHIGIDPKDERIPIGPGNVISAGAAFPMLACLPIEDVEFDGEKRLIAGVHRKRFGGGFFKQSFRNIVGKIECGFRAVGHVVSIVLVECNRASVAQAPLSIFDQAQVHPINVIFAGVFKPLARQIGRLVAQGHVYIDLLVHGGIVSRLQGGIYSYFSSVVFVHVGNVAVGQE